MKKLFISSLLYLFLSQLNLLYSYDTSSSRYFPIAVGNCWTYYHGSYPYGGSYRYKVTVTGTIVTNNHLYYIFSTGSSPQYIRIDSMKNAVMVYDASTGCPWLNYEHTLDSLSARLGDSSMFNCSMVYKVTDTTTYSIFSTVKKRLTTSWTDHFEAGGSRTLAKDFGFVGSQDYGHTQTTTVTLLGCIISGILYGDTSLTGINKISSEIPDNFSLSQNYPNPFNPITKIKFSVAPPLNLPLSGGDVTAVAGAVGVRLIIYDVLGREVATLINQQMQPGSYSVDWDASAYPSGVYFYKLSINNEQLAARKMVLIK